MVVELTHNELIDVAYKWVLKNTSCGVALREINTNCSNGEYPDVIGFGAWGHSVLVEVKVSRSDFLADRKKRFRKEPEFGMGTQRFYLCPTGLIKVDELPEGWGLVYVNDKLRATTVHKAHVGNIGERHEGFKKNLLAEHGVMYSVLRRLHKRNLIDTIYTNIEFEPVNFFLNNALRMLSRIQLWELVKSLAGRLGIVVHDWVPVGNYLPEYKHVVWVTDGKRKEKAYHWPETGLWYHFDTSDVLIRFTATHWREIDDPELPKK